MLDNAHIEDIKKFVLSNIVTYCDKCGTAYRPQDLTVLYNNINAIVIQATCSKCNTHYIVQLMQPLNTAKKIPTLLDIQPRDVHFYVQAGPVSNDVVLKLHQILSGKKTSLKSFLDSVLKSQKTK